MTESTPKPIMAQTNPSEHTARYEVLRRYVIEPHHALAARDGLVVLLRQGVAAWMDAWSKVPTSAVRAVRAAQGECERPPLSAASAEVVHVLVSMALGQIEEVHA
jgi:hypothetical protein